MSFHSNPATLFWQGSREERQFGDSYQGLKMYNLNIRLFTYLLNTHLPQ